MFKILIVDDNTNRTEMILKCLEKDISEKKIYVQYELEVKKAIMSLQQEQYDLLILDVQLPSLDCKENIDARGGVSLLNIIEQTDRIKKPLEIIGITSYDENYSSIEAEFRGKLCLLLKCDMATTEWISLLSSKVNYLMKAKTYLIDSEQHACLCDCVILTAVKNEMDAVLSCGLDWNKINHFDKTANYYYATTPEGYRIVVTQLSQMGMVAAGISTTKAINYFRLKIIAMVGIAAGREGRVELGDAIVADCSWDYGSGKIELGEGGFVLSPDPRYISIDPRVRAVFAGVDRELMYKLRTSWNRKGGKSINSDTNVHVGSLPSGAAVIQTEELVSDYIELHNRKMLGLDMETYAVYYAAENAPTRPLFVSIKSVSDYANSKKNDDYQAYASYISISLFLEKLPELIEIY